MFSRPIVWEPIAYNYEEIQGKDRGKFIKFNSTLKIIPNFKQQWEAVKMFKKKSSLRGNNIDETAFKEFNFEGCSENIFKS